MVRPASPRYGSAAFPSSELTEKSHYIDTQVEHKKFVACGGKKSASTVRIL
jgi:hypothetical protein